MSATATVTANKVEKRQLKVALGLDRTVNRVERIETTTQIKSSK